MASSGLSQNSKLFSEAFNHCKSSVRLRSSSSDNTVYTAPDGRLSTFSRGLKTPLENSTLMLIVCVPIYCELSSPRDHAGVFDDEPARSPAACDRDGPTGARAQSTHRACPSTLSPRRYTACRSACRSSEPPSFPRAVPSPTALCLMLCRTRGTICLRRQGEVLRHHHFRLPPERPSSWSRAVKHDRPVREEEASGA